MPVFEYTALDAKGKTTSGIIDADGASAARQKLRATGIFPVAIKGLRPGSLAAPNQIYSIKNGIGPG
jgi:general secretion pathway protein F